MFWILQDGRRCKTQTTVHITFKLCYLYFHTTFIKDNYISKCLRMRICKRLSSGWGMKASRIQRYCLLSYLHNGVKVVPSRMETLWVYSDWISTIIWINITKKQLQTLHNITTHKHSYITHGLFNSKHSIFYKKKVWFKIKPRTGHPKCKLSNTNELRSDMNDG